MSVSVLFLHCIVLFVALKLLMNLRNIYVCLFLLLGSTIRRLNVFTVTTITKILFFDGGCDCVFFCSARFSWSYHFFLVGLDFHGYDCVFIYTSLISVD